jgi:hypothetical protein
MDRFQALRFGVEFLNAYYIRKGVIQSTHHELSISHESCRRVGNLGRQVGRVRAMIGK